MSDKMSPVSFNSLINWIFEEYKNQNSIFGIPEELFYIPKNSNTVLFNENLSSPLGPAAGPHTQMAQNIIAAYLTGSRFFELKTVQIMDTLEIDKPCIDAQDEGYNVEWSQELTLEQSFDEYLKAWFVLHLFDGLFNSDVDGKRSFIFNMSVGYDLAGIKKPRMDRFIESIKDAAIEKKFEKYKEELIERLQDYRITDLLKIKFNIDTEKLESIIHTIQNISSNVSNSVTLSTMHGCPPEEIESIAKYLIKEKGLHTYIKLNPTLLGYEWVNATLTTLGYNIKLEQKSFDADLKFSDAIILIKTLQTFAEEHHRNFGIKLSNTLAVKNILKALPGDEMYMSGRSLYPLTINLAYKLAKELDGNISISFSGGAAVTNVKSIIDSGIYPVTLVTDLLKPGGYLRLNQIAKLIDDNWKLQNSKINLANLESAALQSLKSSEYKKSIREIDSIKIDKALGMFDCYIAPCQEACPIQQDVPDYINLMSKGNYEEALNCIIARNPLPHITGYICDHQCMQHCTRWDYDSPLLIRDIKKEAAENAYSKIKNRVEVDSSINVSAAIIGAGPAGLTAAYFLAKKGFDVTVFDSSKDPGGTVQNVIPNFRLPQEAINNDVDLIKSLGAKFEMGIDRNFSVDNLFASGFKYIFIGIGAGISNKLKLNSTDKEVVDSLDFLWDYRVNKDYELGENVVVVGGGNTSMDSSRAALRCSGVKNVKIIYRRTKEFMPADMEEFYAAMNDGVEFHELLQPVEWKDGKLKCRKMELSELGDDGRRRVIPIDDEFQYFNVDSIITAIGENVDVNILKENGILFDDFGNISTDKNTFETNIENVFIGGDALRGPSTVVLSMADGKKAAEAILEKENISFNFQYESKADRNDLAASIQKGNVCIPNNEDLVSEADRCLLCSTVCNKCVDVCPNRANIALPSKELSESFSNLYQIMHIDSFCNECGNCETFCPYIGAPYKEKFTIFWSEEEFNDSMNDGIFLAGKNGSNLKFLLRSNSKASHVTLNDSGKLENASNEIDNLTTEMIWNLYRKFDYLFTA
ncbi:MAG: putative selenate reductase subunit YgfK [Ignavibacteriae bacterium]|nr:putative selenate reductase subunit YgfK [Ignavibacteriota bacterium]NOG96461.1 putative selenate reductase subunit YgfK [Ignavibacteriota bacterium]